MLRYELTITILTVMLAVGVGGAAVVASTTAATAASPGTAAPALPADGTPATNTTCTTVVTHDAFRTDNETIATLAGGGPATSTTENTRVRISEDSGFYRVAMDNPNGYCVHFRVFVAAEAMDPASLPGAVESTNGTTTATWEAVHDWNTSTTYTRIEATVPASTSVAFAPSTVRVKSLSWVSQQESTAEGVVRKVKSRI